MLSSNSYLSLWVGSRAAASSFLGHSRENPTPITRRGPSASTADSFSAVPLARSPSFTLSLFEMPSGSRSPAPPPSWAFDFGIWGAPNAHHATLDGGDDCNICAAAPPAAQQQRGRAESGDKTAVKDFNGARHCTGDVDNAIASNKITRTAEEEGLSGKRPPLPIDATAGGEKGRSCSVHPHTRSITIASDNGAAAAESTEQNRHYSNSHYGHCTHSAFVPSTRSRSNEKRQREQQRLPQDFGVDEGAVSVVGATIRGASASCPLQGPLLLLCLLLALLIRGRTLSTRASPAVEALC